MSIFQDINIDLLFVSELNIRYGEINQKNVNKIAESIEKNGLINPITVRKKDDKYEIIAGQHRFEAIKKLLNVKS